MKIGERVIYTACEIEGPNLIVVRRCAQCGAMPEAEVPPSTRVFGLLPERCIREHGNTSIAIRVGVPDR